LKVDNRVIDTTVDILLFGTSFRVGDVRETEVRFKEVSLDNEEQVVKTRMNRRRHEEKAIGGEEESLKRGLILGGNVG